MEAKQIIKHLIEGNSAKAEELLREQLDERAFMNIEEVKVEFLFETDVDFDHEDDDSDDYDGVEDDEEEWYPIEFAADDENEEGYTYDILEIEPDEDMDEARKIIFRVTHKGRKIRRVKCGPGFKISSDKKRCIKIVGREAINRRLGNRKALRTKKAKGAGFQNRMNRKKKKAMRRRKSLGLVKRR